MCPLPHPGSTLGHPLFELAQPVLQPRCIELIDGERTHAALRASRTASQPVAASLRRVSQGRIHNLHQRMISSWARANTHSKSILHHPSKPKPGLPGTPAPSGPRLPLLGLGGYLLTKSAHLVNPSASSI